MDLDSTICELYGLSKQGAARGYTGVRGYHPPLASCAGNAAGGGATQLHARLRGRVGPRGRRLVRRRGAAAGSGRSAVAR